MAEGGKGVVVPGCETCKKTANTMSRRYMDHLADEELVYNNGPTRIAVLSDELQCIRPTWSMTTIPAEASNKSSDNPKTILIADDSAIVRAIIRQALERDTDFMICGEAIDGTDAVSKAKERSPDLIILDVRMPGLNGVEVAGILRYALPKLRIVLVTMFAEDFASNLTSFFRIDAVVSKTNGLADLTAHVTSLLADRHRDIAIPT